MNTWIALLRGVNVGGKNLLPMKQLVAMLEALECRPVKTYIQSGNAVFRSKERDAAILAGAITRRIHATLGFQPHVIVMTLKDLEAAAAANPFPDAADDPKRLHLFFLASKPVKADLPSLEKLRAESERFRLAAKVFYLDVPNGIGRSKLAANAEKLLGVPVTARNWRSVQKILEMAKEMT